MKYAAVIVETRDLPGLTSVIDNHLKYVPDSWDLIVFGSKQNEEHLRKNYPGMIFYDLGTTRFSEIEYNKLLASERFWNELIDYERVLIFQHDSKLLRKGIEWFLEWDYVGAPWKHSLNLPRCGGNGGLSLRNPKKMRELCQLIPYNAARHGNEDVYFSLLLNRVGASVACADEAKAFSVETIFYHKPIGCHAPEKYLREDELRQLFT